MYSATLEVKDTTSGQKLELYAFKEHSSTIANSSEFIEFDLLEAETFSLSFSAKHMITRVAKEQLTSKLSSTQFNQTNTLIPNIIKFYCDCDFSIFFNNDEIL